MSDEERAEVAPSASNFEDSFLARNKDKDFLSKDIAESVAGALPGISTVTTVRDIKEELKKEDPSYAKIGLMAAGEVAGLAPGVGPVAKTMVRGLGDKVVDQPFKKTRKAYKLFVKKDDKLYPLFVNAADEVPQGTFLEADFPDVAFKGTTKGGKEGYYVPTKGAKREKGEKTKKTGDSINIPDEETRQKLIDAGFITEKTGRTKDAPFGKVTAVAARPGWHSSTNPVAEHLGPQDLKVSKKEADKLVESGINPKAIKKRGKQLYVKRRAEDQVWAEVEMADDTSEELLTYMKERGRTDINDKVPKGGSYSYVDGQADGDSWVVGGDMKINRTLNRKEARALQEELGVKDLPYKDEVEAVLGRNFAQGGLIGEDMYQGTEDYLLTSSSGIDMAEGGPLPDDQDTTQMEMELMLKEQVDPVSGNTAPLGSTPEEVRDDVPINASVGEFMINAQTVNYFGEEFFTNLQETAAEGWERIKGGEESFFRDDELEVDEVDDMPTDEVQSMAYGGTVRGYAKGDEITKEIPEAVGGGYGGYGGTGAVYTGFEMRTVVNPDTGQRKQVAYYNGRPMIQLKGYVDEGETGSAEQLTATKSEEAREDRRELGYEVGPQTFRDKNVSQWDSKDYTNYANSMSKGKEGQLSNMEIGVLQTVGNIIIPGGGFALTKMARDANLKQATEVYNATKILLQGGSKDPSILAANKNAYSAGKNLDTQGSFLDKIGLGGIFGTPKQKTYDPSSIFKGQYQTPNPLTGAAGYRSRGALTSQMTQPATGSDYEGDVFDNAAVTGRFKSQYDLQEALSGELGSDAQYKAAQALHSEGLKKKGLEDTSIYGSNKGIVDSVKDLASQGYVGNKEATNKDDDEE